MKNILTRKNILLSSALLFAMACPVSALILADAGASTGQTIGVLGGELFLAFLFGVMAEGVE